MPQSRVRGSEGSRTDVALIGVRIYGGCTMLREELVFVGTCDIAGHVRGKAFPAQDIHSRHRKGVGWTHSNLMQSAFGPILDTPFGTGGDLMIVPDPATRVQVDFADGSA